MAVPVLLYGSDFWNTKQREKSSTQSAELRFLRGVKCCKRTHHIKNEDKREELKIYNLNEKIKK